MHSKPAALSLCSSTFSTSVTNRPESLATKPATTLNTASLKPPTFRMSLRSAAWVVVYGWRPIETSFGLRVRWSSTSGAVEGEAASSLARVSFPAESLGRAALPSPVFLPVPAVCAQ